MSRFCSAVSAVVSTLFLSTAAFAADSGFSIQEKPGETLDVLHDGKVLARYMCAYDTSTKEKRDLTYKPYLHVFDPEGKAPITKGPGGEFPHHRGIFIGWMKIGVNGETYDRWHMKGGEQIHQKFLSEKADAKGASFTSLVEWTGKTREPILVEERTMSFLPAPAPAYAMIDVTSKLKAVAGETKLDGDPEHSGLQFRPAQEVKLTDTTYLFPKEKADPHKDRDYPWFAETYTLNGKRYSVIYLNHPENPKDAPISAYRDYGRFGAFFRTTIPAGGEATIRARFVISEGELPSADAIQKLWNEYAGQQQPTPPTTVRAAEVRKPATPKPAAPAKAPAEPAAAATAPAPAR